MILINNFNDSLSIEYVQTYFKKMCFVVGGLAKLQNKF